MLLLIYNSYNSAAKEREIKSIMGIRVHPAIKFMMSPRGTCWHVRHVISMTALQSASLLSSAQTPGKQYSSSTAVTICPCLPKAESPKCQGTKLQNSCTLHLSIVRCICRCACCAASCSEGLAVRPDALFVITVVMVSFCQNSRWKGSLLSHVTVTPRISFYP